MANWITNLPVNGTFNVTAFFGQEGKYWKNGHKGIDIVGDRTLYSVCDGTVKVVGWDEDGWGRYVSIEPTGFPRMRFILCHMVSDSVKVKVGQKVSRTTVIGTMGTTGNSSGVHVHVEMRIDNVSTDPTPYLGLKNEKASNLRATDYKTTVEESNKILQEMQDKKDGITKVTFKKGDTVKIKPGARTYTNGGLKSYVYDRQYKISSITDDRAVLKYGAVTVAAMNVKDLTLVKQGTIVADNDNTQNGNNVIFEKNDIVKIKQGAKTYTGGKLASYVYPRQYKISSIKNSRAVLKYGLVTVAAMNVKDLILVKKG